MHSLCTVREEHAVDVMQWTFAMKITRCNKVYCFVLHKEQSVNLLKTLLLYSPFKKSMCACAESCRLSPPRQLLKGPPHLRKVHLFIELLFISEYKFHSIVEDYCSFFNFSQTMSVDIKFTYQSTNNYVVHEYLIVFFTSGQPALTF